MLVQRWDFAEKQHNLALGSRSGWFCPQRDTMSANGEKDFAQCIELHARASLGTGYIGTSSSAVTTIGFCWKTSQFGSRETRIEHYGAGNGYRAVEKQRKMYWCIVNHVKLPYGALKWMEMHRIRECGACQGEGYVLA